MLCGFGERIIEGGLIDVFLNYFLLEDWYFDDLFNYLLHYYLFLHFFNYCDWNLLLFNSFDEDRLNLSICFLVHFF